MRVTLLWRPIGLLLAAAFSCIGQLDVPRIGYLAEPGGALRPLAGIGGNFLLGEPVAHEVRAAVFAGRFGLVHASDRLVLVGPSLEPLASLSGLSEQALLAVSSALPLGVAWLPERGELCRLGPYRDASPNCFPLSVDGAVRAAGVTSEESAALAVERNRALWLMLVDLEKRRTVREMHLAGIAPPVALLGEDILFCLDGELVVRRADGSEIRSPSPVAAPEFEPVGRGWVSLRDAAGARWIVRVSEERLEVFCLAGGAL